MGFRVLGGWACYVLWHTGHKNWPALWSTVPSSGSRIFVCMQLLFCWLRDTFQILCASSVVLHSQIFLVWLLGSIWHYHFSCSPFGTVGHLWWICDARSLFSARVVCLLVIASYHVVDRVFFNFSVFGIDPSFVPLVCTLSLWFLWWNLTYCFRRSL